MKKNTKSALLLSVVSIVICCTMLLGTTMAWFTDSVTSARNTIVAGNLDVVLQYWDEDTDEWVDVDENTKLFDENALYEPGYTEIVKLRVANAGTLALKYELTLNAKDTVIGKTKDGTDIKLSEHLQIGSYRQDEYSSGANYWDVLSGFMFSTREQALSNVKLVDLAELKVVSDEPVLAGEETSQIVVLVLHMPTTVGNEANHNGIDIPKLELGLTLLATQHTDESDSFGSDYDKDATYPEGLLSANAVYDSTLESGVFTLGADLKTSDSDKHYSENREYAIKNEVEYTIDLNGHTIEHDGVYQDGNNTGYTYLYTTAYNGKLTINGEGTIVSKNTAGQTCIIYAQGPSEVVINGGNFNASNGIPVWAGKNSKVTINGGSFISTDGGTDQELIYSSGGVIDIFGGFFHNTEWENRPVNVADANRSTGFINIFGGTFVNFDPSTGGNDPNNILVADGYKVISETQDNGDVWYTVVPE